MVKVRDLDADGFPGWTLYYLTNHKFQAEHTTEDPITAETEKAVLEFLKKTRIKKFQRIEVIHHLEHTGGAEIGRITSVVPSHYRREGFSVWFSYPDEDSSSGWGRTKTMIDGYFKKNEHNLKIVSQMNECLREIHSLRNKIKNLHFMFTDPVTSANVFVLGGLEKPQEAP